MKQETKNDLRAYCDAAFLALIATGFAWWHKSVQGDLALFGAIFCINGVGLVLYTVGLAELKAPRRIFLIDAIVLFLLLQISHNAAYWSPVVLTIMNALIVKLFVKDWRFSVLVSVCLNVVGFAMGYILFFLGIMVHGGF